MDNEHYIPRFLDHPKLYPIFTMGETIVIFVPTVTSWLITKSTVGMMLGLIVGMSIFRYLKYFKAKHGEYVLPRMLYWHFPSAMLPLHKFPHSHIREYIG